MTNFDISAQLDAVLGEQQRELRTLEQESESRAQRGVADVAANSARFRKLAERVREGARDRARSIPRDPVLDNDDPLAALEDHAAELDETPKDPTEPTQSEIEELLDTMGPPPSPAEPEQIDTSLRQWSDTKSPAAESTDDDFEFPW